MITYQGLDRNFRFLVLEVRRQLETMRRLVLQPSESLIRMIQSRDNYTDTLKALIEKKCISFFRHTSTIDKSSANLVTAINVATVNLERIADFCINAAGQVRKLQNPEMMKRFRYEASLNELIDVFPRISNALEHVDVTMGLQLCRVESTLDGFYADDFQDIRTSLQCGRDTDDLLCCLYIAHYLERMGDSLLNIGEAVLFAATGEKLKLHEYKRLQETLGHAQPGTPDSDVSIDFSWETRSGCRIAKIHERSVDGEELEAVFKKGQAEKLRKEQENIERWSALLPGVPPRILDFRDGDEDAALLLQFLEGYTLRDLALNGDHRVLDQAMDALEATLRSVWTTTRRDEPINAGFMDQVFARLEDVFRLHPQFKDDFHEVGNMAFPSLEQMLEEGREVERHLDAPFRVLIHGDLNADNVIYDQQRKKIHLIDLYRSRESDYIQDVSVFLVSNFRLPVMEGDIREALNHVALRLYRFALRFAEEQNDTTFGARMALGLARSFITSTRFEVHSGFARTMYTRAVYLLEKVIQWYHDPKANPEVNAEIMMY